MCKKNTAIEELWPYKVRIILAKWVSSQYLHALQFDNACRMGACSIPQWVRSCPTPALEQSYHTNVSIDISCPCQSSDCILCMRYVAVFISHSHKHSWWGLLRIDWNTSCTMGDFAWHPGKSFSSRQMWFINFSYKQNTAEQDSQLLWKDTSTLLKVVMLSHDLSVSVWVHVNGIRKQFLAVLYSQCWTEHTPSDDTQMERVSKLKP